MAHKHDDQGREIPDQRPITIPVGGYRPESLESMMRRMIRETSHRLAEEAGVETLEEASDFEVEDEEFDDVLTEYEEMGSEQYTRGETEEGDAAGQHGGPAESSGLRSDGPGDTPGGEGPSAVPGNPPADKSAATALHAAPGEAAVAAHPATAPVQRPRNPQKR